MDVAGVVPGIHKNTFGANSKGSQYGGYYDSNRVSPAGPMAEIPALPYQAESDQDASLWRLWLSVVLCLDLPAV